MYGEVSIILLVLLLSVELNQNPANFCDQLLEFIFWKVKQPEIKPFKIILDDN